MKVIAKEWGTEYWLEVNDNYVMKKRNQTCCHPIPFLIATTRFFLQRNYFSFLWFFFGFFQEIFEIPIHFFFLQFSEDVLVFFIYIWVHCLNCC